MMFFTLLALPLAASPTSAKEQHDGEVARFSLDIPMRQEMTIAQPDGTVGVIGIEPMEPVPSKLLRSNINLGNGTGTWKFYYYTAILNTSYRVQVNNYRITRCFDNYSSGIGVVVDSCTLKWGSTWSQQTTRHHEELFNASDTRFLNGNIEGHSLVTSVYYG